MKAGWHRWGAGLLGMGMLVWGAACQKVELPVDETGGTEQTGSGGNGSQDISGTGEHPLPEEMDILSVAEVMSVYAGMDLDADYEVCVIGYIVGSCTGSAISTAKFSADGARESNLLIADAPDETDVAYCMPVELKNGSEARDELNLASHPGNLGRRVALCGLVKHYFRVIGLKGLERYEWKEGEDIGETPEPDTHPEEEPDYGEEPPQTEDENETITVVDTPAVIPDGR